MRAPGACNAVTGARLAAGSATTAVTCVDEKCVLAETGDDENGVVQSERHNELRVDCPSGGNPLGVCKAV